MSRHRNVRHLLVEELDDDENYDDYDDYDDDDDDQKECYDEFDDEQQTGQAQTIAMDASTLSQINDLMSQEQQKRIEQQQNLSVFDQVRATLQNNPSSGSNDALSRMENAKTEIRNILGHQNFPDNLVCECLEKNGFDVQSTLEALLDSQSAPWIDSNDSKQEARGPQDENYLDVVEMIQPQNNFQYTHDFPKLEIEQKLQDMALGSHGNDRNQFSNIQNDVLSEFIETGQRKSHFSVTMPAPKKPFKVEMPAPSKTNHSISSTSKQQIKNEDSDISELRHTEALKGPIRSTDATLSHEKQRKRAIDASLLDNRKNSKHVTIIVAGHVDAGKSTLIGHICQKLGLNIKKLKSHRSLDPFSFAWVTDEDAVEREHGVTIDIGIRHIRIPKSDRLVTFIDAPGHRDFVPAMIMGASMANTAILVVDSGTGEFEAGFSENGQTREHTLLLRSLGISKLIVAVNKMDKCEFSKLRFDEIRDLLSPFLKQVGFKMDSVIYIPVAGITGENLVEDVEPDHPLAKWPAPQKSLLQLIDDFVPQKSSVDLNGPTCFAITDISQHQNAGTMYTGTLYSGTIAKGDKLMVIPSNEIALVKSIQIVGAPTEVAIVGDSLVMLSLQDIDLQNILVGNILCDPERPLPLVSKVRAQILTMRNLKKPILQGHRSILYTGRSDETAIISKLVELLETKEQKKETQKSRCFRRLTSNQSAIVEIKVANPMCIQRYSDMKELGRFLLRENGQTVAAGVVLEVLE